MMLFCLSVTRGVTSGMSREESRLTAFECHTVVSLQSGTALAKFLDKKLWNTEQFTSLAMSYGQKNEETARESYRCIKGGEITVTETGLWVSSSNPEHAVLMLLLSM